MDLDQITAFFQWMTVIHVVLLTLSSLLLMSLKGVVSRLHGRLFGIEEEQVRRIAYDYLGRYKGLVLVFSIVPWLALLIVG
ncbi:MAG: DUF6868 family protein [Planctomycetota bacterium]